MWPIGGDAWRRSMDRPSAAMWLPLRLRMVSASGKNRCSSKLACAMQQCTSSSTLAGSRSAGLSEAAALIAGAALFHRNSMARCSAVKRRTMAWARSCSSPRPALRNTAGNSSLSSSAWCSTNACSHSTSVLVAAARHRAAAAINAGRPAIICSSETIPMWHFEKRIAAARDWWRPGYRVIDAFASGHLSRNAFAITEAELRLIASAAIIGDSSQPVNG